MRCSAGQMQQGLPFGLDRLCPCTAEFSAKVWLVKANPMLYVEKEVSGAGVLSQSQVLLAFGVVAELFNGVRDAEPLDGELERMCTRHGINAG